jgi:hypothetical protein
VLAESVWWCGHPSDTCRRRQLTYARVQVERKTGKRVKWQYVPTPVQTDWHAGAMRRSVTRIGVGGAAGPGKSRWGREHLYWLANQIPGFHALLLRKTHKDLDMSHLRFLPHEVSERGGQWRVSDRMAVFPHPNAPDAIIRAGHMETAGDVEHYLSSEYDVIFADELVTFDRDPMLELFSRARSTNPALFALRGLAETATTPRLDGSCVIAATNPGGRGALWVKEMFMTHAVDRAEFPDYTPARWIFFPARLRDNPYMAAGYRESLQSLPPLRRRQLEDGDWDAYAGQFFGEWRTATHVRTLDLSPDLEVFGSMDWGYNAPGVMYWWVCLPDGHYHIRREYKFQHATAEEVGGQIHRVTREMGLPRLRYIACDPAMWQHTGAGRGESVAETLLRLRVPVRKSDNDRFNGWLRVHELLRPDAAGVPWLTVDPACTYLIRTIPAMVQDPHDADDMDTTKDDHAADAVRFGAMSRPSPSRLPPLPPPGPGTWGWAEAEAERAARAGVLR